jgi:hypothetical protein
MNYKIERKLLDAGLQTFDRDTWYEILNAIVDDFQKLIGCNFERDSKSDIKLNIDDPLRVSTTIGMWTPEKENKESFNPTQAWLNIINHELLKIQDTKPRSLIKWYGFMSVDMYDLAEQEKIRYLIGADITLFLFAPITGERLYLENGKSLVRCRLLRNPKGGSKWINLNWMFDDYDEWEHFNLWNKFSL